MYLVKEVAQLSGVSVRTLHHYDRIGLLCPQKADNGYRYYSEENLEVLQQILFYKYLGFALKEIQDLLQEEETDQLGRLEGQLDLLEQEQKHLSTLINTIKKTIQAKKGEIDMSTQEKFTGFTYKDHERYHNQAVEQYGKTVVEAAFAKQKGQEELIADGFNHIFSRLADNLAAGKATGDTDNLALAEQLLTHIRTYAFDCSLEVFSYIGRGYVENPDFKHNIDQFGQGVAQYASEVIANYVTANKP